MNLMDSYHHPHDDTDRDYESEMSALSKRLAECQEEKNLLNEERSRYRSDNLHLQERIHIIEEQAATNEQNLLEKLEAERQRSKELFQRWEREKELENENHHYKYEALERDLNLAQKEVQKLRNETEEHQRAFIKQTDELDDLKQAFKELEKEKKTLRQDFENYRREAEEQHLAHQEELDELAKHTDELLDQKQGNRPRIGSMIEQVHELESRLEIVQQENRELREQSEELKAQLLTQSVQSGQMLLQSNGGLSLAAELNGMDSQELQLMKALHEQELVNQRLRAYIDEVLIRVVTYYPDILNMSVGNLAKAD